MEPLTENLSKNDLLSNDKLMWEIVHGLPDFAVSNLAQDIDILRFVFENVGCTVAHILAKDDRWLDTAAANTFDVLQLKDRYDQTVAHVLAMHHEKWRMSKWADDLNVLMLKNMNDISVAHIIARHNPQWIHFSKSASNIDVLTAKSKTGKPVAFELLCHERCLELEALFDKRVLTLEFLDMLIAEHILENDEFKKYISVPEMILKLIKQGAAYKPSFVLSYDHALEVLNDTVNLIDDEPNIQVKLKFAKALYSTIFYCIQSNKEHFKSVAIKEHDWNCLISRAEKSLERILTLFDNDDFDCDIFCEPSIPAMKQLSSKRILNSTQVKSDIVNESQTTSVFKESVY